MATTTHERMGTTGEVFWRGEPGYDERWRNAVWNARKPPRYPEVIVMAQSDADVAQAVRAARRLDLKVSVRSGGHSLCGAAVRDGGMLIDLSGLREVSIDAASLTATAQPAVSGRELTQALGAHGLAFPVGHCGSVALGGYLLSGGFGWNMGSWGPACFSVRAVEVVTASGDRVVADPDTEPDLFWAARGSGSGFFGVATRFHLGVQPLPRVIRKGIILNPVSDVETVSRWANEVAPSLPGSVELFLVLASAPSGAPAGAEGKAVGVVAVAFADTEEEAAASLAFLETCPKPHGVVACSPNSPASYDSLFGLIDSFLPQGKRFAEDALWCDAALPVLMPAVAEHVVRAPAPGSHVLAPVIRAQPGARLPDAAFSLVGRSLLLCYAVWDNEADDVRNERWHRDLVRSLERFTIGHYIAESDLLAEPDRAERSFAPEHWQKLESLRRRYDPDSLFCGFLGR
jgi:FAD/FMN-containing dehydrogenase